MKQSPALQDAIRHFREMEKYGRKYRLKPSLSAIARHYRIAKSSLWYALNKGK